MLNAFRRSLGYHLARWQFRKEQNDVMSFTDALSSGHSVLLILPLTPQTGATGPLLEWIRTRYGGKRLTIVAAGPDNSAVPLFPRSEVIRIPDEEVTRFYHPSTSVLESVRSRTYDVAIDLNLDFLLPSGYICRASNARFRVGFTRPGADLFYNFQVTGNGAEGTALYDRLAACLKMF
jgi:hypothetical protein